MTDNTMSFSQLALAPAVLEALSAVGYEHPTPIQQRTIPIVLSGADLIGQAQTGTGKTAAFALPVLSRLDLSQGSCQALVLAPTRELAIQVAEAFQTYASKLPGFHVLPIYGGQDYRGQLRGLQRGAHVIVGTPGRVMDHMRRGTLKLDALKTLVLDEADEMLRMGFIDDVEWILERTPETRQIALFSATMPSQIQRIARQHLREPQQVKIEQKAATAETIRQRYWPVAGLHKLDALTRILEAEDFDAMIVFVRTKLLTQELADKLEARGFAAAALNGDMVQKQRERTIDQLKQGKLDIIVATDVAARGLDVERISHVVNYDIPHDAEAYVHRIGRTGRAGRSGEAILFVAPRERRMLSVIERATRKPIDMMALPSTELINDKRIAQFKQSITDTLAQNDLGLFSQLIEQYQQEHNVPAVEIAAALASQAQGGKPLLLEKPKAEKRAEGKQKAQARKRENKTSGAAAPGMQLYRVEVGRQHQLKPGNLVGAIANEAELDAQYIGRIDIYDSYSVVALPEGMPKATLQHLKKVWVAGQKLQMSEFDPAQAHDAPAAPPKRRGPKKAGKGAKRKKPKS